MLFIGLSCGRPLKILRNTAASMLALSLLLAMNDVRAEDVSAPLIESAIKESGDFPPSRQFTVQLEDREAHIATYIDKESKQPVIDCKIDAVLVARRVFQKFPSMVRVVVDFYPTVRRKIYRQVSVTKPEVLAFGTGQVNQEDLLNALRVEELVDKQFVEQQRQKEEAEQKRKDESADAAKKVMTEAKSKGTAAEAQWTEYNAGPFTFQRPVAWKIADESGRQTVVEFDSSYTTKRESAVELKLYQSKRKTSVISEAQEHVHRHMRFRKFQITQKSKVVKFGVKNAFTGVTESFSHLNHDGEQEFEENIYFGWPGMVYRFSMECRREDYHHLNGVFKRLLSTVKLRAAQ